MRAVAEGNPQAEKEEAVRPTAAEIHLIEYHAHRMVVGQTYTVEDDRHFQNALVLLHRSRVPGPKYGRPEMEGQEPGWTVGSIWMGGNGSLWKVTQAMTVPTLVLEQMDWAPPPGPAPHNPAVWVQHGYTPPVRPTMTLGKDHIWFRNAKRLECKA